jgi:phosphoserine phosphatase RsbU/P
MARKRQPAELKESLGGESARTTGGRSPVRGQARPSARARRQKPAAQAPPSPSPPALAPQLSLISQVTDRLVRTVDFDEALRTLIEGATELLEVERGSIMIVDRASQTLAIRVSKGIDDAVVRAVRIPLGEGIAGSVASSGVPLVVEDIRELPLWQRTVAAEQRDDYRDFSALCVPLVIHGTVQGVMNFNHKRGLRPFNTADLEFAQLIANQAAVALYCATLHQQFRRQQEMEVDLRVARGLQKRFLTHPPPAVPSFAFHATCQMCNEVGGDYFDFIPLGDDRLAIVIGDAAGHGLGAALLATDARAAVRSCLKQGDDIERCMFEVNNIVQADTDAEMFMTLIVGVLDARRRRFRFATAGHPMPLVVHDGKLLRLPLMGSNIPLGIRRDIRFIVEQPIDLRRGDVLFLFTDGVWEATDSAGRRFGTEVMPGVLERCHVLTPQQIAEAVLAQVMEHREAPDPEDDYTMIVARAT